jgi:hypothetical protein
MCGVIGGLDLGDAILEGLVVRAGLCQLIVHSQRQLSVPLLEIELRHRLVDERFRTGAGGHAFFFPGFSAFRGARFNALRGPGFNALRGPGFDALRNPRFNALGDPGLNAHRRGDVGWRGPGIECVFVIRSRAFGARQRQHGRLARETLGANGLGRFRLCTAQTFGTHLLVLPASPQTFGAHPHVGHAGVERLDRIVSLEPRGRCSVRTCR